MYWQRWVEANGSGGDAGRQALLRQGELWRSLLSGETRADDLLGLGDYRQAFVDYTHQVALVARKYPLVWLAGRSSAKPATLDASPGNSAAAPKVIDAPAASAPET